MRFGSKPVHIDIASVFLDRTCREDGPHYNGSCDLDIDYRQVMSCDACEAASL